MRNKNCLTLVATASATLVGLANVAQAHPGHPVEVVPSQSPLHFLFQPEHAVVWVAALGFAAVIIGNVAAQRVRQARAGQSVED